MKLAHLEMEPENNFLREILSDLRKTPKRISPKWFYDENGAKLFDLICQLPEYYPTRTEVSILKENVKSIAALLGESPTLYEFGSGAATKVDILLNEIPNLRGYVPIDICSSYLNESVKRLNFERPALRVSPIQADFTLPFELTDSITLNNKSMERVGFFPGSTIGNFTPREANLFLSRASHTLGAGGKLLVGVDLVKDIKILESAYNDAQGVTRAFNLNVLSRLNREFGTNFNLEHFEHLSFFNTKKSRIEMHLLAKQDSCVSIAGQEICFSAGERLHTENSYKYNLESFRVLVEASGFDCVNYWTDPKNYFAVFLLQSQEALQNKNFNFDVIKQRPRSLTCMEEFK